MAFPVVASGPKLLLVGCMNKFDVNNPEIIVCVCVVEFAEISLQKAVH